MKIITKGRTEVDEYFRLSGIRESKKLSHHPFIVFIERKNEVEVEIVDNIEKLLTYPLETSVMAQWGGRWASDFFQFSVWDLKNYIEENPKQDWHIA